MNDLERRYPYVSAWCDFMDAGKEFRKTSLQIASVLDAPRTALFRNNDGWITFELLEKKTVIETISELVKKYL